MRKSTVTAFIYGSIALTCAAGSAQPVRPFTSAQTAATDSIASTIRLKNLRAKRIQLQNQIRTEDAKRNRQLSGVTPETMEQLNERQDSICLALRSQLTDVNLEIREISPRPTSVMLMQQYGTLIHRTDKEGNKAKEEDAM